MRITPAPLLFCLAWAVVFPLVAGEPLKSGGSSGKASQATPSTAVQPTFAAQAEAKNAALTSPEDAIRAEIDQRKEHIKEQEAVLKAMWNARDFTGSTSALRAAAEDKRRILELKQRLKEMKKKAEDAKNAATASTTPAPNTVAGSGQ